MPYQDIDFGDRFSEIQSTQYNIADVLRDPNILDPTHTLFFIGPGSLGYHLEGHGSVDGPMDGLTFLTGYLDNQLIIVERPSDLDASLPPNVFTGGCRATEEVFATLRRLPDFHPFEVVYFDMNNITPGQLRQQHPEPITILDNTSHRFWGPRRQGKDNSQHAQHVMSQYSQILNHGDRLLLTFKVGGQELMQACTVVCEQVNLQWKAINVESDFPTPPQIVDAGLSGGNIKGTQIGTVAQTLLIVDRT